MPHQKIQQECGNYKIRCIKTRADKDFLGDIISQAKQDKKLPPLPLENKDLLNQSVEITRALLGQESLVMLLDAVDTTNEEQVEQVETLLGDIITYGKLFVVLGTKGGVGTSTVAVNLAVQLAQVPGKSAMLLDFSRPMGDVAALLDLKPSFQLRDAMENFNRLDSTLLGGLLTTHKSGLKVLAGATHLEDWQHASFPAIERLVEIAQQGFDFVVMDFGSFYSAEWQSVLRAAEVLLVSEADLPGLAKLHRHLDALANLQISSTQLRLIINRWHRHDEQALEKVENDMKMPVFARLPNSFKQVSEATVRGDSLKKGGDALSGEFQKMATRIAGLKLSTQSKKYRLAHFFCF